MERSPFFPLSDSGVIYRSSQVRETVQHFFHAREQHHALFLLTGEVGTGKTTAIRAIERELPEKTAVAHVHHATSTESELADELCRGFGLPKRPREAKLRRIRRLEVAATELAEKVGRPVVILDEAHLVSDPVLEAVRLLTNFTSGGHPVFQVCLAGQPELAERLRSSRLRQLRQRITLRYTMLPLRPEETELYLIERLRAAASEAPHRIFDSEAVRALHEVTGGIPREINVAADHAMTTAYAANSRVVHVEHVRSILEDFGYEGLFIPPPFKQTLETGASGTSSSPPRLESPRDTVPIRVRTSTQTVRARDVRKRVPSSSSRPRPPLPPRVGRSMRGRLAGLVELAGRGSAAIRRGVAFAAANARGRLTGLVELARNHPAAVRVGLAFAVAALLVGSRWISSEAPASSISTPATTVPVATPQPRAAPNRKLSADKTSTPEVAPAPAPSASSRSERSPRCAEKRGRIALSKSAIRARSRSKARCPPSSGWASSDWAWPQGPSLPFRRAGTSSRSRWATGACSRRA